jgi:hypothetical protein
MPNGDFNDAAFPPRGSVTDPERPEVARPVARELEDRVHSIRDAAEEGDLSLAVLRIGLLRHAVDRWNDSGLVSDERADAILVATDDVLDTLVQTTAVAGLDGPAG